MLEFFFGVILMTVGMDLETPTKVVLFIPDTFTSDHETRVPY